MGLQFPRFKLDYFDQSYTTIYMFFDLIFEFKLDQLIMAPTHKWGNLLDVILTNTNCVENISVSAALPYGISSDHYLINFP